MITIQNFYIFIAIHRGHLAAKYLKYDHVVKTVLEIVNFISSSAKIHHQFNFFVEKIDEGIIQNEVNYYCIVRWLSTGNVLKMFVDVFEPICTFFKKKGRFTNNWETLNGNRT